MTFTPGTAREFGLNIAQFGKAFQRTGRPVCAVILNPHVHELHAGHLALLRAARALPRAVTVLACGHTPSPSTSAPGLVDAVFRYSDDLLWPHGLRTHIRADHGLEPADALSTELTRTLAVISATRATDVFLGEKDFELLVSVHQALQDLHLDVRVHGVPAVRHSDGLAVSERNRRLNSFSRPLATSLSAALTAAAFVAEKGAEEILRTAHTVLDAAGLKPDYVALRGVNLGTDLQEGAARLLIAATIDGVRIVDSAGIPLGVGFHGLAAQG